MIDHADFYESGRIGAEITYSILKKKLGVNNLILNEPGRGGPDLKTTDNRVVAESRFLVEVKASDLEAQLLRDLAQMTRKLRREFRYNPKIELGYAVTSFLRKGTVKSFVIEVTGP